MRQIQLGLAYIRCSNSTCPLASDSARAHPTKIICARRQRRASASHFESVKAFSDKNGLQIALHPPYSPDLAPCDFDLFGYTKLSGASQSSNIRGAKGPFEGAQDRLRGYSRGDSARPLSRLDPEITDTSQITRRVRER
jgi:hypothetical protein